MDDSFLQSTLKSGLFDIGDSDERLKWLQQSVTALVKYLKKDYSLLSKFSLVALDPNISDEEPVLNYVEEIVTKYWKALRGKYPDMPRNIHRGVILNALMQLGAEDPIAARIIYLTSYNFYPYAKLRKEKDIIGTLLTDLAEIAEKHAIEEWSLLEEEPKLKLQALKMESLKSNDIKVDKAKIKAGLQSGLNARASTGHYINHGLHEPNFQVEYLEETSKGLAEAFNSALAGLNSSLTSTAIEVPINKFFTSFKKSLDENLKASFASIVAVERRSKLLWWKETLYSPSLKKSYREISSNILPIIMGIDLNNQVTKITPISVDYLLKDTILILNEKKSEKLKFKDFLNTLSKYPSKSQLIDLLPELNVSDARIGLTDFIVLLLNDKAKPKEFSDRTGIKDEDEISTEDLSVAIFHDLLTKRLSAK